MSLFFTFNNCLVIMDFKTHIRDRKSYALYWIYFILFVITSFTGPINPDFKVFPGYLVGMVR